jgi:hypothetical protein
MKLTILQKQLVSQYPIFLRQAGYTYIVNKKTGQESFVRSFGKNNYPRWHIYVNEEGDKLIFNIHLDQKQPSYQGMSAHSGEYDSSIVKAEIERLKQLIERSPSALSTAKNSASIKVASDERTKHWSKLIKGN